MPLAFLGRDDGFPNLSHSYFHYNSEVISEYANYVIWTIDNIETVEFML